MDSQRHILIVDDDPGFRKTLSDILKLKGYASIAVERGRAALEQIQAQIPTVALIDLKLADMSGLALIEEIKAVSAEIECIVLTGYASQASAIEAINLGAYGYLQKPYAVEQLLVMIRRAIEKRQAEDALQRVAEQRQRLLQMAQSVISTLALDEVIRQTQQTLQEVLAYDFFGFYWLDEETKELRPSLIVSPAAFVEAEALREWAIPPRQGLLGAVVYLGQEALINNAHLDPRSVYPPGMAPTCEHVIILPIRTKTKTLGALIVGRITETPFTEEEFELTQLFNSYVSLAVENARLFEQTTLSEKRYRTLFEESKDAIFIITPDGKIVDANPAAVELSSYSSWEELLHVDVTPYLHTFPGTLDQVEQSLVQQGFVKDFEFVIKRRDGRKLTVLGSITAVRDENGDLTAYQGIIRDITERKQLEAQLHQSQKMEAIGRLAGGVAHDFNNLLTVIKGYAGLLLSLQPDESNQQSKDIEQIMQAAEQAATLTRQLLAFSRQQPLQPKIINLNQVMIYLEKMLRRLIGEDIDLTTMLADELGQVKADPGQIEQVIMNLAVNARDAMPQGGKLTVETANIELDESYARHYVDVTPGTYVMLAVSDTGQGMNEEVQSHIFEPFFTTKEPGHGTGLGLATVHGIVKQSNGHISVYSEPGQGTVFKIYLPQVKNPLELTQPDLPLTTSLEGRETILLVEDNEMVRQLVQQVLDKNGYRVLVAHNGEAAIQVCKMDETPIQLLVTDVIMPGGMNGYEVAKLLTSFYPAMKVLYMSGYADEAIVRHGILEEGTAFLQKPFTPKILAQKVREVLDTAPVPRSQ
jgi:PAS domain S-box-containing protein